MSFYSIYACDHCGKTSKDKDAIITSMQIFIPGYGSVRGELCKECRKELESCIYRFFKAAAEK